MYRSCMDKESYIARINRLKTENLKEISGTREYSDRKKFVKALKKGRFDDAAKLVSKHLRWMLEERKRKYISRNQSKADGKKAAPNYFSDEEIAVYTVIFGDYDHLYEPKCRPDNCRFFLISDTIQPPEGSAWKRLDLSEELRTRIGGMNDTGKNRFLKMMPHLLFPEFTYSVYLDGNIRMVTDPTEFINHMPEVGMSVHRHVSRDCVYEEAKAVKELKKAPKGVIEELIGFLRQENMPANYGLLECPVIVRRHNQPECIKLMEEWWKLFERFPYRDQMLLPLVLYRNGLRTEDLAFLGKNVRYSPSFRRYSHPETGKMYRRYTAAGTECDV